MDKISSEDRSRLMAKVKSKDTKPEIIVRKLVFSMGYRYRLHDKKLPGHPDLVFSAKKKIIFVNGCFWHRHEGCKYASTPQSKTEYWNEKFSRTIDRDRRNVDELIELGWQCLVIWECELKEVSALTARIVDFLKS